MDSNNLSRLQQYIYMLPVAFGIGLAIVGIFAIAQKFQNRSAVAKAVVNALKKDRESEPSSRSKRIVVLVLAGIVVLIPIAYKYMLSDSQKAAVVEFIRGH